MSVKHLLHEARSYLGIERNTTSHAEKLLSALGGIFGILAVYWGTRLAFPRGYMNTAGNFLMVTSVGASAVLLLRFLMVHYPNLGLFLVAISFLHLSV